MRTQFTAIGTGRYHACAIQKGTGTATCWGTQSILGNTPGVKLKQISIGDFHSCGLSTAGKAFCWGKPNQQFRKGQIVVPSNVE